MALPTQYIVSRRNEIYKSSKIMREFYIKEAFMRTFVGAIVGLGASIVFYGVGPVSMQ